MGESVRIIIEGPPEFAEEALKAILERRDDLDRCKTGWGWGIVSTGQRWALSSGRPRAVTAPRSGRPPMTDPMELVGRLNSRADIIIGKDGYEPSATIMREAAACIREMVEQKPFAHFQWNDGWHAWEQVVDDAAGDDGVVAAYRLPPAPGAEA